MAEQASAWQQIPRRKPRLSFMSLILGYFDEAGCPGVLPSATSNVQPILSIMTVTAPAPSVQSITREYLKLKRRFFRNRLAKSTFLDSLLLEIKGGDLRTDIRMGNSRVIRHHIGFFDHLLDILEQHDCFLFGRVYVKPVGGPFAGN